MLFPFMHVFIYGCLLWGGGQSNVVKQDSVVSSAFIGADKG
jgi:hypothetical protein